MLKIYCKDPKCAPERQHTTDAGIDLRAAEDYIISTVEATKIHTGVHVEIPPGYVGLVVPRSSLGMRGLRLANTIGVIDADYRGEIICAFKADSFGALPWIDQYERIAQLVIVPCAIEPVTRVKSLEDLSETERGEGGFGSTGKH